MAKVTRGVWANWGIDRSMGFEGMEGAEILEDDILVVLFRRIEFVESNDLGGIFEKNILLICKLSPRDSIERSGLKRKARMFDQSSAV